ncbi:flavoredoxin [Lachnospiraceae bacterium KM106-2]|nr:flavoredoxin [Lachnospiraceae bacterium KM106-2]
MMRKNFGAKPFLYPQPVLIIGTYNEDGTANAMNAAWGGLCGANKIIIDLSSHRTTDNILKNKEFTVSIADAAHVVEADYVGIVSANKVPDKLEKAGLHTVKSEFVNAPIIEEFPMTFECKLLRQTEDGIVGEIINVNIDERVLNEKGTVDTDKLGAITFDAMNAAYVKLGEKVGNAFSDGKKLAQ